MPRHPTRERDGKSFTRAAKNARHDSAREKEIVAMKCAEARKLVRLYLDSELDAKNSFEVEQHLESCAECAGLFEAEKKFDARLGRFLRGSQPTRALWEKVEAQIAPFRTRGFKALWPVALAASLIIAAGVVFFARSRTIDLANAVEECHSAYVHQLTTPEFTGAVPEKIAQQFGGQLDAAAFAYRPSQTAFTSSGARLCHVEGVPVALILGRNGPTPVSLIVFKKSELDHFPNMKQRLESGDPIVCGHSGPYQFAARLIDDHVVCVVGDTPRPVLENLLKTLRRADG
jgi:anti-sigma factor RsiW